MPAALISNCRLSLALSKTIEDVKQRHTPQNHQSCVLNSASMIKNHIGNC